MVSPRGSCWRMTWRLQDDYGLAFDARSAIRHAAIFTLPVVCPGSLAEQWQDELYSPIRHLPFEILN